MATRLGTRTIGPLKTVGARRPTRQEAPSPEVITSIPTNPLNIIPEYQLLQRIPGISPYLIPELIPDLIYLLQWEGLQQFPDLIKVFQIRGFSAIDSSVQLQILNAGVSRLAELITQADPSHPSSIIFQHPSQGVHEQTQKVEIELIKDEPDVEKREDIVCPDKRCASRRVQLVPVQTRSADEPPTIFARCAQCKVQWRFSAA